MKTRFVIFAIVFITIASQQAHACTPTVYFLFGKDAREMLDSLELACSQDYFLMGILAHNISFSDHDDDMTERAKKYFKKCEPNCSEQGLAEAYRGSLKLLEIRDRWGARKVGETILGWIPKIGPSTTIEDAEKAFEELTQARSNDQRNVMIRFVRATACVEIAEHSQGLLPQARDDLRFLYRFADKSDTVQMFFLELIWAKYEYRKTEHAISNKDSYRIIELMEMLSNINNRLIRAEKYACTNYHWTEIDIW